jgi:hypothetical protein
MPVREFLDSSGRAWRAWDILPEAIHPRVKAEDYLADCYETGWVVFETTDGSDKRRLCPFPRAWETATEDQLRQLLDRAEVVPPSRSAQGRDLSAGLPPARNAPRPPIDEARATPPDVTELEVIRSFRYPGGRLWSVGVVHRPEGGGPPVLRFTAGSRSIDLRQWPNDWPDYPDDRLVELLRRAAPRRDGAYPPFGTPPRRYNDLRPD